MLKLLHSVELSKSSKIDTNSRIPSSKVANKSLATESISTQMEFNDFCDGMKSISAVTTEANSLREFGSASTKYVGKAHIKSEEGEFMWYCDLDPKGDISRARAKSSTSACTSEQLQGETQTFRSPPFIVGFSIGIPCEWSVQLLTQENEPSVPENYIGLGLRLNKFLRHTEPESGPGSGSLSFSRSPHVAVHYQVAHLSETGYCILRKESAIRTFGPDDLVFGWTEFLPRKTLMPDSDGHFIFAVYLTMYEMTIPEAYDKQSSSSDAPIPMKRRRTETADAVCSSPTQDHMQNGMFTATQINDKHHSHSPTPTADTAYVQLSCRGEKFLTTLKSLTDHSDYFKNITMEIISEKGQGQRKGEYHIFPKMSNIEIEVDFCDPSTLRMVLDFCRTKKTRRLQVLQDYTSALALLQASMKLGIPELEKNCVVEILCRLTPQNFPAIVYNLWLCKAQLTKSENDVLSNFFEANRERITKEEGFKNFYRQNPLLFFDMLV